MFLYGLFPLVFGSSLLTFQRSGPADCHRAVTEWIRWFWSSPPCSQTQSSTRRLFWLWWTCKTRKGFLFLKYEKMSHWSENWNNTVCVMNSVAQVIKKELTLGVELCKGIPSHLQPRVMLGQRGWDWGKDGRSWSRWGDTPTRNPIVLPRRTDEFHQLHGSWPQGYGAHWPLPVDTTLDIL